VVCNSLRAAGEVMAWHEVPAERIRVVPTAVDLDPGPPELRSQVRRTWGIPEDGRAVLFLGHGFRRKNLPVAVEAFADAADPRDRLVVAGSDAHERRWLDSARDRLGSAVVVAPRSSRSRDWLVGADVLLHPTLYDAASNAVLEALALGVPPVVSARDGAAERVADRRLVVGDPASVKGFARALRYALGGSVSEPRLEAWPESRMLDAVEDILRETIDG
jgi:UDP-glucose:(heptosyl)LPS alpha-1,3-glucosyltransferase